MFVCFRIPAISFLSEVAAAGPYKHWELEDSEPKLKVDLEVYARSLDARELHAYCYISKLWHLLFNDLLTFWQSPLHPSEWFLFSVIAKCVNGWLSECSHFVVPITDGVLRRQTFCECVDEQEIASDLKSSDVMLSCVIQGWWMRYTRQHSEARWVGRYTWVLSALVPTRLRQSVVIFDFTVAILVCTGTVSWFQIVLSACRRAALFLTIYEERLIINISTEL